MRENKGRFPWRDWAKYEAVNTDGRVWQFESKPTLNSDHWKANHGFTCQVGLMAMSGNIHQTLIARYIPESGDVPLDVCCPVQALTDRVAALEAKQRTDTALVEALTNLVASLSKDVSELRESQTVNQSGDVPFDSLRFFVPETQPDPTAQKVEALKLLFEWRDGGEFMTVDLEKIVECFKMTSILEVKSTDGVLTVTKLGP